MIEMSKKIRLSFNKAAPFYHQFDGIQKIIGAQLISQLPKKPFYHVIDLGCGTGRTTKSLIEHIKFNHCDAIDISELMIEEAIKNYSEISANFSVSSFDSLLNNNYDLVFSNLALHWSSDFNATLRIIYAALKLKGYFIFSVPLPGTFKELRSNVSVRQFISYNKILNLLMQLKFRIIQSRIFNESLTFDTTLDMLRSLKKTGATVCQKSTSSFKKNRLFIKNNSVKTLSYRIGTFMVEKYE